MTVASPDQEVDPYASTDDLVSGLSVTFRVYGLVRSSQTTVYPVRIRDVSTTFPNSIVAVSPVPSEVTTGKRTVRSA